MAKYVIANPANITNLGTAISGVGAASKKAAPDIDDFTKSTQQVAHGGNQVTIKMKFWRRQMMKLGDWFAGTRPGKIYEMAKRFQNWNIAANVLTDSVEELRERWDKMSVSARKFTVFWQKSGWAKTMHKIWDKMNDKMALSSEKTKGVVMWVTRLGIGFLSLVAIASILVFAFGLLYLAIAGPDNALTRATEDMWGLHDALVGISKILSGEGEASLGEAIAGFALLAIPAFALLGAAYAPYLLALYTMLAVYRALRDEGVGMWGSLIGSALVARGVWAALVYLVEWFAVVGMAGVWAQMLALGTWFASSIPALIISGLALLFLWATGRVNGWFGWFVGIAGAFALRAGLLLAANFLVAIGAIPAVIAGIPIATVVAIIAGFALLFAYLYRHKDVITKWVRDNITGPIKQGMKDAAKSLNPLNWDWGKIGGSANRPLARASGGPISAGRSYLVGERGPELFTSASAGRIIPNHELGGSTTNTNNISLNIDVSGVTDRTDKRALAREISDMLNQEMRRMGGQPTRGRY